MTTGRGYRRMALGHSSLRIAANRSYLYWPRAPRRVFGTPTGLRRAAARIKTSVHDLGTTQGPLRVAHHGSTGGPRTQQNAHAINAILPGMQVLEIQALPVASEQHGRGITHRNAGGTAARELAGAAARVRVGLAEWSALEVHFSTKAWHRRSFAQRPT
eukprot:CAMPEP_0117608538 /NCGR_PEP_ID=MMETSP0784-20121206/80860_1 /TAXON_ID=39447 /ORGANISM="" /LENGTH=158 /DNA_ID=CAMNT_0005411815 /DNA_START=92 /DNA_END=569 /DNA_ORIENTATION=+